MRSTVRFRPERWRNAQFCGEVLAECDARLMPVVSYCLTLISLMTAATVERKITPLLDKRPSEFRRCGLN